MKLRWYIERTEWKSWDDRSDKYYPCSTETIPVLQYEDSKGKWIEVPTVTKLKELGK